MSDQITYNPGAVSDFASDVGSRAGQLHMIYEDTASKTNALQGFSRATARKGFRRPGADAVGAAGAH